MSNQLFVPRDLYESPTFVGDLYGYCHAETGVVNVTSWGSRPRMRGSSVVGQIVSCSDDVVQKDELSITIFRRGAKIDWPLNTEPVDLITNIFSRNTGILETGRMQRKGAVIVGCGSVGSLVALELARSGVSRFLLIDNDILSYHNLCRHQCGMSDVGARKVDAVESRILEINPYASVLKVFGIVEMVEKRTFDDFCDADTIFVGCADNREGDVYTSKRAMLYSAPFVSIGLWERAFAGELFYCVPEGENACYVCPFGTDTPEISNRKSENRRIYTTEEDLSKVNFEPGISVDISFVSIIGIKIIIDLLNRNDPEFVPRIVDSLSQYTLICNTNKVVLAGDQAEIFAYPLQVTRSLQVDCKAPCPPCKYRGTT